MTGSKVSEEVLREVRATTERFAREVLAPRATSLEDPQQAQGALEELAELGFLGVTVSEAKGGVDLGAPAYALIVEALAGASPSVARRYAAHAGPALAVLSTTDRDLEDCCSGAAFATFVLGLSPAPAQVYVGLEHWSEHAAVQAADTMGHRGAGLAHVELQQPRSHGAGRARILAWHGLGLAALALGSGRAAIGAAIRYALERRQFQERLADFQAIQWKIADSVTALDAAGLMVAQAARSLSEETAAAARTLAARAALLAADHALQIHGGYGYTREYPVERQLRSARMCSASDRGREIVSRTRLL